MTQTWSGGKRGLWKRGGRAFRRRLFGKLNTNVESDEGKCAKSNYLNSIDIDSSLAVRFRLGSTERNFRAHSWIHPVPIPSMYIPTWMVDFSGKCRDIDASPMESKNLWKSTSTSLLEVLLWTVPGDLLQTQVWRRWRYDALEKWSAFGRKVSQKNGGWSLMGKKWAPSSYIRGYN